MVAEYNGDLFGDQLSTCGVTVQQSIVFGTVFASIIRVMMSATTAHHIYTHDWFTQPVLSVSQPVGRKGRIRWSVVSVIIQSVLHILYSQGYC
jgi:hypothetical protein